MLDSDTKRRIDTARDILVGKVPDPKSQVEQITIALIYKFMDDMDAQAEELGGKRKFFAKDFARYGWAKLMSPSVGGHELIGLYGEGIAKMPENPGIPTLFRDIFKNAYLPYRDPETLKAFLKIINEFDYDHSERLGDAFEYLLSILGSQGDAGQFRTPRHIIDFMVRIVDPKKTESILDPACGTAGFLISAYKHIEDANRKEGHSGLTPDEKKRLAAGIKGYDISPDMVRLSLANMYLHGFTDPHIYEYDTLTQQDRWNETADVILANPPFMSPKGGIKPHNRFGVQSKRSEVLFVDYMAEHLSPGGRAGIIVPEGIIFQGGTAYVQLRKMLASEFLVGVISLPSGVFMPYSGVKTSILILDRNEAKRNPGIIFSDVRDIGFSLGVKRTPSESNDLPAIERDFSAFYRGGEVSRHSWIAPRAAVLEGDCNLSGARYRPALDNGGSRYSTIGEVCTIIKGASSSTKTPPGPYRLILTAADSKTADTYQFETPAVCVPLISSLGHGKAALHRVHYGEGRFALADLLVAVQPRDPSELDTKFLYYALDGRRANIANLMRGAANVSMKPEDLAGFEIPLPPLEVQREIVAEIEGYQKVIDGARAVVDNYRPHIPIRPEWPMVEVGALCKPEYGFTASAAEAGNARFIRITDIAPDGTLRAEDAKYIDLTEEAKASLLARGDLLVARTGATFGKTMLFDESYPAVFASYLIRLRFPADRVLPRYYWAFAQSEGYWKQANSLMTGGGQPQFNGNAIQQVALPLPSLDVQRQIVAAIESEQRLVAATRELIARFETKIAAAIARVWGEDTLSPSSTEAGTAAPGGIVKQEAS